VLTQADLRQLVERRLERGTALVIIEVLILVHQSEITASMFDAFASYPEEYIKALLDILDTGEVS
jgi:hypothetical protein